MIEKNMPAWQHAAISQYAAMTVVEHIETLRYTYSMMSPSFSTWVENFNPNSWLRKYQVTTEG